MLYGLLALFATVIVVLDQLSKLWIVANRFLKEEVSHSNSGKYYRSKGRRYTLLSPSFM